MFTSRRPSKEEQERMAKDTKETLAQTKSLQQEVGAQKAILQKQQAFLGDLAKQHKAVLDSLAKEVATLKLLNERGAAEVHNLKTAKIVLKNTVTERFQQQLTRSLQEMEAKIQADTTKIESLSAELHLLIGELKEARAAVNQFKALARTISEADYNLKEHAKALKEADQDKLKLMKRIDELEGIIAKFKRSPRREYR